MMMEQQLRSMRVIELRGICRETKHVHGRAYSKLRKNEMIELIVSENLWAPPPPPPPPPPPVIDVDGFEECGVCFERKEDVRSHCASCKFVMCEGCRARVRRCPQCRLEYPRAAAAAAAANDDGGGGGEFDFAAFERMLEDLFGIVITRPPPRRRRRPRPRR